MVATGPLLERKKSTVIRNNQVGGRGKREEVREGGRAGEIEEVEMEAKMKGAGGTGVMGFS